MVATLVATPGPLEEAIYDDEQPLWDDLDDIDEPDEGIDLDALAAAAPAPSGQIASTETG